MCDPISNSDKIIIAVSGIGGPVGVGLGYLFRKEIKAAAKGAAGFVKEAEQNCAKEPWLCPGTTP